MSGLSTVITPKLSLRGYIRDFFRYFELLLFLIKRDFTVRYKQTLAGGLWAVLVPLLSVVALTFVFRKVAGLPGNGPSYGLMVYAAMMPWQIFANAIQTGSLSLLNNTTLVTKLYFPRIIMPLATQGVALVDWSLNFLIFLIWGAFAGLQLGWGILMLPVWLLLTLWVSAGPMLLLSSALVNYRDLRFVTPFIVQFGLFLTPVGFSSSVVPEGLRWLFNLNPMVGVVEGFRWSLLGVGSFPTAAVISCLGVSSLIMLWAVAAFLKRERTMADII